MSVETLEALDREITRALAADAAGLLSRLDETLTGVLKATNEPPTEDPTPEAERYQRRRLRDAMGLVKDEVIDGLKWDAIASILNVPNIEYLNNTLRDPLNVKGHLRRNVRRQLGMEFGPMVDYVDSAWSSGLLKGYNTGGGWAARELTGGAVQRFSLRDENILNAIRTRSAQMSQKWGDKFGDDLSNWLTSQMLDEGRNPLDAKRYLRGRGWTDLTGAQIDRIARTEANVAVSWGKFDTYLKNGVEFVEWQTHVDGQTRDSHRALDGQQVKIGERFSNGLRFPGDPSAPASEIINCRCNIAAVEPERVDPAHLWDGQSTPPIPVAPSPTRADSRKMVEHVYRSTLENGGATWNPRTGQYQHSGFAVAEVDGTFERVPVGDREAFERAVNRLRTEYPDAHVGTWVDGDTIHVDPSRVYRDKYTAVRDAIDRNQKAIFHLDTAEEINFVRSPRRVPRSERNDSDRDVREWFYEGQEPFWLNDPSRRTAAKAHVQQEIGRRMLNEEIDSGRARTRYEEEYLPSFPNPDGRPRLDDWIEPRYGVKRQRGETDEQYLKRVVNEGIDVRLQNRADTMVLSWNDSLHRINELRHANNKDPLTIAELAVAREPEVAARLPRRKGESDADYVTRIAREASQLDPEVRDFEVQGEYERRKGNYDDWAERNTVKDFDTWTQEVLRPEVEEGVNATVKQWSYTSGDDNPRSLAHQLAAREEFGLTFSNPDVASGDKWPDDAIVHDVGWELMPHRGEGLEAARRRYGTEDMTELAHAIGNDYIDRVRRELRHQYNYTQDMLRANGVDQVTLYRGMAMNPEDIDWLQREPTPDEIQSAVPSMFTRDAMVTGAPMQSWSLAPETALNFGNTNEPGKVGVVVTSVVPADRIMATARTGLGCLNEQEFIVLDSMGESQMMVWDSYYGRVGGMPTEHHFYSVLTDHAPSEGEAKQAEHRDWDGYDPERYEATLREKFAAASEGMYDPVGNPEEFEATAVNWGVPSDAKEKFNLSDEEYVRYAAEYLHIKGKLNGI